MAAIEPNDLITFAEVIEHLYTSPVQVLKCVASWLAPDGVLLLQTPNPQPRPPAVAPDGKESVRDRPRNADQSRTLCEYTVKEIHAIAACTNLRVERFTVSNHPGPGDVRAAVYNAVCAILPANFRDGITMGLRKP